MQESVEAAPWHRLHPLSPVIRAGRVFIGAVIVFAGTLTPGSNNTHTGALTRIVIGVVVIAFGGDLLAGHPMARRGQRPAHRNRPDQAQLAALSARADPGHRRRAPRAGARLRPGRAAPEDGRRHRRLGPARLPDRGPGGHRAGPAPGPVPAASGRKPTSRPSACSLSLPTGRLVASILIGSPTVTFLVLMAGAFLILGGALAQSRDRHPQLERRDRDRHGHRLLAAAERRLQPDGRRGARRAARSVRPSRHDRRDDPQRPRAGGAHGRTAAVASAWMVPPRGRRRGAPAQGRRELPGAAAAARGAAGRHSRGGAAPARTDPARRAARAKPAALAARWKAPLRYHNLSWGHNERCAVTTTGRLARVTSWVPLTKVQSLRLVQGPVQRGCGSPRSTSTRPATAVHAAIRDRDADEARVQLGELTALSRSARRV